MPRKFKKVKKPSRKLKENIPSGNGMSKQDEKKLKRDKEQKKLRREKTQRLMNTPDEELNGCMLRMKKKYLWAVEK